jgi:hypothetical protein
MLTRHWTRELEIRRDSDAAGGPEPRSRSPRRPANLPVRRCASADSAQALRPAVDSNLKGTREGSASEFPYRTTTRP